MCISYIYVLYKSTLCKHLIIFPLGYFRTMSIKHLSHNFRTKVKKHFSHKWINDKISLKILKTYSSYIA